jgi:SAM-dependent methyltransferase
MIELTPSTVAGMPKNGPTDPIEFYRRPLVGWLFRERINLGLRLLPERRFGKALEIGYGAGALQLVMAPSVDELHGIDLDADPAIAEGLLARRGQRAHLVRGSVYELPYEDATFDLVFCFSVFEHLHEYTKGLREVARVLAPDGLFLLGMPAVNMAMEVAFRAIGFKGIEDHHVTTPAAVARAFDGAGLRVRSTANLDFPRPPPIGMRLYSNWLLEKPAR